MSGFPIPYEYEENKNHVKFTFTTLVFKILITLQTQKEAAISVMQQLPTGNRLCHGDISSRQHHSVGWRADNN